MTPKEAKRNTKQVLMRTNELEASLRRDRLLGGGTGSSSRSNHYANIFASIVQQPRLWLILLVIYQCGLNLSFLGSCQLLNHEDLAAARAQGMVTTGYWLVPHLNGQPDVRKPPLPFWFSGALSVLAGRINEWTVRIPSALASLGTMLLIVCWVRSLRGWRTALLAGFVFATSVASLLWGRRAEVDMQLCFWTTSALIAYWYATNERRRKQQVIYCILMWSSLGLGIMTKGPLPLGIFAVTVLSVAFLCRQKRHLGCMLPVAGPLILFAITIPWAVYVELNYPGSLSTWYMQSIGRITGELGYYKPFYFYLLRVPILLLPWVFFVCWGVYLARRDKLLTRAAWVYLLAWGLGGLLLLSLSAGKRIHYALLTVPPFIILAALAGDYVIFKMPKPSTKLAHAITKAHGLAAGGLFLSMLVAAYIFPLLRRQTLWLSMFVGSGLGITYWLFIKDRKFISLACFAVVVLASQLILAGSIIPRAASLNDDDGVAIGRFIAADIDDSARVCFYRSYDAGLAFYARRPLPVLHSLDELDEWLKEHADSYIIVRNNFIKEHRDRFNSLKEVYFKPNMAGPEKNRFVLLKFRAQSGDSYAKQNVISIDGEASYSRLFDRGGSGNAIRMEVVE